MTFPLTGILDNFNRANEGPPITGFTDVFNGMKIVSNLCTVSANTDDNISYYSTLFGADQEAYITLSSWDAGGGFLGLIIKMHDIVSGLAFKGYFVAVEFSPPNVTIYTQRVDGDLPTAELLDSVVHSFQAGDTLGVRYTESTLTIYINSAVLRIISDNTYSSESGYLAIFGTADTTFLDDFGGGDIPAPNSTQVICQIPNLPDPILRVISADGKIINLLGEDGWKISDPYWRPQIAQYKNDGYYVDSAMANDTRLVFKTYAPVTENIPLSVTGRDQLAAINTIRQLLQLGRQASDYWTESYEFDNVWLELRPPQPGSLTGYARIKKMQIPELSNPFGQPFFTPYPESVMEDISLIIEREPLWRGVAPGDIIGPLFNLIKNPDFELWNFGITDSQPDSWSDLETTHITGSNNRESDDSHSGNYALRVRVGGSTAAGRTKGVSQVISGIRANTEYTAIAWVRNDGVGNGVGRILITYSSQLELYRSSSKHGWQLYAGTFTTGAADTVAINCEILTTSAGTDGTLYFDSLMILEGNWEAEALNNMLPYMTSSHVVNHWDQVDSTLLDPGDINCVDAWNVPGDESALVRLEMVNNTPDSGVNSPVVFQMVRAGMRRARDVFQFANFYDPPGILDTTASGDDRIESGTLGTAWTTVGFFTIDDPDIVPHNLGRFRVLARVRDASTSGAINLEVRLRYWIGQAGTNVKTLDSVTVPNRGSWYVVDLTGNTALNWDIRSRNLPSSLGFEIQMRRATGTSPGYLDYVLKLPTDGGILVANISPSISIGSGLVVDGTNSTDVYGARLIRGWREVYQGSISNILKNFNGALYIGGIGSVLHRYQNNGGAILHDYSTNAFALETYNNKLYVMIYNGASAGQAYSTDGSAFPGTPAFTFGKAFPLSPAFVTPRQALALQGHLYIIGFPETTGGGVLWDWDGSSAEATQRIFDPAGAPGTPVQYNSVGSYKNKLYISTVETVSSYPQVVEYDPATMLHSTVFEATGSVVITGTEPTALVEFGGYLYWITGGQTDKIYRFDGSTWETLIPLALGMEWHAATVAGDRFYIAGSQVATNQVYVLSSENGEDWITEYLPGTTTAQDALVMGVSQGQVFMVTNDGSINNSLHAITLTESQFKVPDYQLTPFLAPSRERVNPKRHRYFFSFSRESGVDVTDDAMLVGVGIVPQFLSLIGDGS